LIVIRTSRTRLALLFCGSLGFVAAGFWFILWPPLGLPVGPTLLCLLGIVSILFFGMCGGILLRRLFGHRVALIVDRRGILDNSSAIPAGRIPWEEIAGTAIVTESGQRFVGIDVTDREGLYGRVKVARLLRSNADTYGFPVLIPEITLDRKAEVLREEIDRLRVDKLAREALGESEFGL